MEHAAFISARSRSTSSAGGTRVATRLLWLAAAIAVPLLGLATLAILRVHDNQRATQESALLAETTNIAQLIDREFARIETGLHVLARAVPLAGGNLDTIAAMLRDVAPQLDDADLALLDASGHQILASNPTGEHGETKPVEDAIEDAVRDAIAHGQGTVSDLLAAEGTAVIAVTVPIPRRATGPHDPAVLVAVLPRTRLADTL
ncbi:MAG: hypothetical protein J0H57_05840, partial [Rhodospirillales bacterium]|nr:hypothetical protein [Rhodospirillales bacterium]